MSQIDINLSIEHTLICLRIDVNNDYVDEPHPAELSYLGKVLFFFYFRTFTCNMRAFGLSKELCLEFLRKQSTIANLRDGKF